MSCRASSADRISGMRQVDRSAPGLMDAAACDQSLLSELSFLSFSASIVDGFPLGRRDEGDLRAQSVAVPQSRYSSVAISTCSGRRYGPWRLMSSAL